MRLLNEKIRYIAVTVKEVMREKKELKEIAVKKKSIMMKLRILKTLKTLKVWNTHNLKSKWYEAENSKTIIKKAAESIEIIFILNFNNSEKFINYVKNELSENVKIMMRS